MRASCQLGLLAVALAAAAWGCQASQSQLDTLKSQNRSLSEQSRAQLAEIENLKIHARGVEDRLIQAEQDLARFEGPGAGMPGALSMRLVELAERYSSLQYDPSTGTCKLDTDVLFDSGDDRLKPGAEQILTEMAGIFSAPEAHQCKLMVVGHTDARGIKGRELREKYPTNWHLSAGRALTVADWLRDSGIPESRMGVAGFGRFQPVSPNDTAEARRRNRRVEIYVLGPQTPIVGWANPADGSIYR